MRSRPVVADPFCGSGTVLLESTVAGCYSVGSDVNPLARLISEVKVTPLGDDSIMLALDDIQSAVKNSRGVLVVPDIPNIEHWYEPRTIESMGRLTGAVLGIEDDAVRKFMMVCLSRCARLMSAADPRVAVPVRIQETRKEKYGPHFPQLARHLLLLKTRDVLETFSQIVRQNAARLSTLGGTAACKGSVRLGEKADELHLLTGDGGADLVLTSPPYPGAQKYIRSSGFGLAWLGLSDAKTRRSLERQSIGRERFPARDIGTCPLPGLPKADDVISRAKELNPIRAHLASCYLAEMRIAFTSIERALRSGGAAIIVIGGNTLCGIAFDTPAYIREIAEACGLTTAFVLSDRIRSRGLMTKRHVSAAVIGSEKVIYLRKP